jgi:hypothetical protein
LSWTRFKALLPIEDELKRSFTPKMLHSAVEALHQLRMPRCVWIQNSWQSFRCSLERVGEESMKRLGVVGRFNAPPAKDEKLLALL